MLYMLKLNNLNSIWGQLELSGKLQTFLIEVVVQWWLFVYTIENVNLVDSVRYIDVVVFDMWENSYFGERNRYVVLCFVRPINECENC